MAEVRQGPIHSWLSLRTGMALSEQQCRRLDERLEGRDLGQSARQYLEHLQRPEGAAELAALIEAAVVRKTELFRDEGQLAALRAHVLAPLAAQVHRPLQVWSAGCATGEEVATLLVLLAEVGANPSSMVLGTDLSEANLVQARALSFSEERMQRVPAVLRERYFAPADSASTLVKPLRERARFLRHNLMDEPYPGAGGRGFDVILCRNVLIYFTPQAAAQVVGRLAAQLVPGGMLVLSATEPLLEIPPGLTLQSCDNAYFYARAPDGAAPSQEGEERAALLARALEGAPPPPPLGVAVEPSFAGAPPRLEPEVAPGESPSAEAEELFARVLDWAASGEVTPQAAEALGRCLALDPDLAPARYLQGMLLEQRGALDEAAQAYRRALRSLERGRGRPIPFFLNPARLQVACVRAIERLGRAGPPAR